MPLPVRTKIAVARILNRYLRIARKACGLDMHAVCRRGGLTWDLDLDEGIDLCIYLLGSYESAVRRNYEALIKPGDVVLDVGANIGAHTLHFARAVGPAGAVHAFEPTDYAFGKLRKNLALNPAIAPRVQTHQLFLVSEAASGLPGEICSSWPVDRWKPTSPDQELNEQHLGLGKSLQGARAVCGDDFFEAQGLQRLDLVKVDVDGNEPAVLTGLHRTLTRFRPAIIVELAPFVHTDAIRDTFDEYVQFLHGLGYAFYDANTRRPIPATAAGLRAHITTGSSINGLLLFPAR